MIDCRFGFVLLRLVIRVFSAVLGFGVRVGYLLFVCFGFWIVAVE